MLQKRKQLFNTDFYRMVYFVPPSNIQTDFEFHQSLKKICPKLEIASNLPKGSDITGNKLPKLFILDDLSKEILDYKNNFDEVFTKSSHHQSLSVIYTNQNYFSKSSTLNVIRNCTHQILFFPNELSQLRNISCKYFSTSTFLENCFDQLEETKKSKKFLYLMIEMQTVTEYPKGMNLRSDILPNENGKIIPIIFVQNQKQ
jgi:hypothetical protein